MKITKKRISKLRRTYSPRASRVRLRLTDKRLRRLERERLKSGKTFESVWRGYRAERISESVQRIFKKFLPEFEWLTIDLARQARKLAIKLDLTYREAIEQLKPPDEEMPYQNKWWDFLGDLNKWTKSPPSDMLPADEFVLEVTFGFLHYEGSIAGFLEGPHVQFREHGDELYGRDQSPPWIIWDEIVRGQWLFDYVAEKKIALRVVVSESGKYEKEAE